MTDREPLTDEELDTAERTLNRLEHSIVWFIIVALSVMAIADIASLF